jgi:hypothetical protein
MDKSVDYRCIAYCLYSLLFRITLISTLNLLLVTFQLLELVTLSAVVLMLIYAPCWSKRWHQFCNIIIFGFQLIIIAQCIHQALHDNIIFNFCANGSWTSFPFYWFTVMSITNPYTTTTFWLCCNVKKIKYLDSLTVFITISGGWSK